MCIYVNGYIYVNENNLCGYKKQDKFEGEESCGQTDIQEKRQEKIIMTLCPKQHNLGSFIKSVLESL